MLLISRTIKILVKSSFYATDISILLNTRNLRIFSIAHILNLLATKSTKGLNYS